MFLETWRQGNPQYIRGWRRMPVISGGLCGRCPRCSQRLGEGTSTARSAWGGVTPWLLEDCEQGGPGALSARWRGGGRTDPLASAGFEGRAAPGSPQPPPSPRHPGRRAGSAPPPGSLAPSLPGVCPGTRRRCRGWLLGGGRGSRAAAGRGEMPAAGQRGGSG